MLAAMQNGLGKLVGQVRTDQTDPSPFLSLAVEWICGFLARDRASPDKSPEEVADGGDQH